MRTPEADAAAASLLALADQVLLVCMRVFIIVYHVLTRCPEPGLLEELLAESMPKAGRVSRMQRWPVATMANGRVKNDGDGIWRSARGSHQCAQACIDKESSDPTPLESKTLQRKDRSCQACHGWLRGISFSLRSPPLPSSVCWGQFR